jgi:ABC-type amino acid transport substrate-binding protein
MLRHCCLCILLGLSFFPFAQAAEEITVPIYDQERAPLSMQIDGEPRGIYTDLFREILRLADIQPTLVPIPPMRRRVGFETQLYEISCCANPAWRQRPREQEIQLFSQQFYWTKDVFVFPKGKSFTLNNLSLLADKRVAVVRGFDYRGSEHFGERINYNNEVTLIRALALGRADVGIVNEDILSASPQRAHVDVGPIHDEASLHIRIHRSREDLVDPINNAIERIIQNGKRDQIVKGYLNQEGSTRAGTP